jgi:hypothetical protein
MKHQKEIVSNSPASMLSAIAEQKHGSALAAAATAPRAKGLYGGGVAGGCGNAVGDANKCPHFQVSMRPFCELSVGAEG